MSTERRPFILVAGMHRSGTSAVAGVLHLLGASLPSRLVPAKEHNPRGYFESTEIVALHDRLLSQAGSRWDKYFDLSLVAERQSWIDEIVRIIAREFPPDCLPLVKDPRICRAIPLWTAAVEEAGWRPVAVIPVRSPFEVAASLERRDGFLLSKSLLIWLRYVLAAERDTRALPRSIVRYGDLVADWHAIAARIADDLQLSWPRFGSAAAVEAFLGADLRHHRQRGLPPAESELVPAAAEGWSSLQALASHPRDRQAQEALDRLAQWLTRIDDLAASKPPPESPSSGTRRADRRLGPPPRRRPGPASCEPVQPPTDPADLEALKEQVIEAGPPVPARGTRKRMGEHLKMLEREFSGQSALLFHHAHLVVHIRRGVELERSVSEFFRLWREQRDFLLRELNLRWLVSACDTMADYGHTPAQRTLALAASMLVNVVKLYETERYLVGCEAAAPVRPHVPGQLFDGVTRFKVGRGDMVYNLAQRMRAVARHDELAGPILLEVFERLNRNDTALRRFLALNLAPDLAWTEPPPD